jgi:hypothetical protein
MGMRIASSNAMAMQSTPLSQTNQKQQHVSNLFSALDSGDISSAQKSYTALGLSSGTATSNSPLAMIGKALDAGDLSKAQEVAKTMKSDATNSASVSNNQVAKPSTSSTANLASELMSDFSSASSELGLGSLVNTLV